MSAACPRPGSTASTARTNDQHGTTYTTPDSELEDEFPMRRAWQMVLFQGKLFCSVLPSGHIKSLEAGKSVTYDHDLPAG